jgi:hypothetical protein
MAWFKRFYDPIILPDGRKLLTYRDAAEYITALPKAEQDAADWLIAMETLSLVAERNAPETLARIAIVKALDGPLIKYLDRFPRSSKTPPCCHCWRTTRWQFQTGPTISTHPPEKCWAVASTIFGRKPPSSCWSR